MGLMDRDYYREKREPTRGTENLLEKLKRNPLAVIAVVLAILFLIALIM